MAEVRFPVFFVARIVVKRDFIYCFPVLRQVVLCQLHSQMTPFELLCKHISAPSVKGLRYYLQTTKTEVCDCVCLSLFLSFWLSFFWAQSVFLSLFALPSYATCRCWDYCCAYLVRCWILFMTLSCVPTVKRLIKHLYLPQIQILWALFFTRL